MKSIKSKILLVVISGLLVITAVVSTIAVTMTHEIMHKDADRILNNATQKEVALINDTLGDVKKSAVIMEHYAGTELDDVAQLSDSKVMAQYLEKTKKMFLEIALNTNGLKGFFFRLNPEYTHGKAGYYTLINDDRTLQDMSVTDLSQYAPNDQKNVGWYYASATTGEALWLDPYYFPGIDTRFISYTIPVYVKSQLLGVIGFDMDFNYLMKRVESISVYENGYAVLVAKDGKTPYSAVKESDSSLPHTKARASLQNGMYLELRADYKDIQKDIHPMLSKIVAAFLVVLFFSILYTVVVTHRIVRPLKQLTSAAEELSTGLADAALNNIAVRSKDEVGRLSAVLSSTYEKIREYTTYINALAYRDSLTGIKNTTAYTEAIGIMNQEINCGNPRFGVVVIDINNLKQTNDQYGHDVGNELIVHTAKILTDTFQTSFVFRIGGDEFVVILQEEDYKQYRSLLLKLDEACSADVITVLDDQVPLSIARGVALFTPTVDRVYEDVFSKADHAMYLNKQERKATRI